MCMLALVPFAERSFLKSGPRQCYGLFGSALVGFVIGFGFSVVPAGMMTVLHKGTTFAGPKQTRRGAVKATFHTRKGDAIYGMYVFMIGLVGAVIGAVAYAVNYM